MQSAYVLLGVPGNATGEDINAAYLRALQLFSRERMETDPLAAGKLDDLRNAYKVLSDVEQRAAHDRKLSAAALPRPRAVNPVTAAKAVPPPDSSLFSRRNIWILVIIAVLAGSAIYKVQLSREATRREALRVQLAKEQLDAENKAREEQQIAAERAAQARLRAEAARKEQNFSYEAADAFARAASMQSQRESMEDQRRNMEQSEARRRESELREEEFRATREAERRAAMDKQRIRELCYQNYRRTNC